MNEQLLPCPFCGGEASRVYTDEQLRKEKKVHIECDICNAKSDWQFARISSADDWWNQRHVEKSVNIGLGDTATQRAWMAYCSTNDIPHDHEDETPFKCGFNARLSDPIPYLPSTEDAKQWKSEQSGFFVSPELDDYVAKLMSDYAMEVLARSGYFDGRDYKGE